MTFILLVAIIWCIWSISKLSERVAVLERAQQKQSVASMPAHAAVLPVAEPEKYTTPVQDSPVAVPVQSISFAQWIGGIGVVALVFAFAFFYKFAINQGWVTEWARIGTGLGIGMLFVTLALLWREKFPRYAEILSGGGLAILYFTVFASYQFYEKVTEPVGFLGMVVVTVLGACLAALQRSRILALVSMTGAYLSPFLLYFSSGHTVALYTYLSLVTVGLLAMQSLYFWPELLFLGIFGSVAHVFWQGWAGDTNTPTVVFIISNYFLVSMVLAFVYRKLKEAGSVKDSDTEKLAVVYGILGVLVSVALSYLPLGVMAEARTTILLLLAISTCMAYALVDRLEATILNHTLVFTIAKFLLFAVMWQFDGVVQSWYVLLVSALLFGAGIALRRKELWFWGVIASIFGVVTIASIDFSEQTLPLFLNARFALELAVIAELTTFAVVLKKHLHNDADAQFASSLVAVPAALLWLAVSGEVVFYYHGVDLLNTRNLLLSVWWIVYAALMTLAGMVPFLRVFRRFALLLFVLAVLKVFLFDVQTLDLEYRVVSFMLLGVILLVVAFYYQKHKDVVARLITGEQDIKKNSDGIE